MRNKETSPQLYDLSRPIPKHLVSPPAPGKYGEYVAHYIIVQALLATVGPFDWELVEILRGGSSGIVKGKAVDKENAVVGAVYRLTVEVDGRRTIIEEIGSVDAYKEPNDGEALKKASSDALKRAAMRLGVAIHLWTKTSDQYFLPRVLGQDLETAPKEVAAEDIVLGTEEVEEDHSVATKPAVASEAKTVEAEVTPEQAIDNLKEAGLLSPAEGEVRLPTGSVIRAPRTPAEWTAATKKEFVAYAGGDVESGKRLFLTFARDLIGDEEKDDEVFAKKVKLTEKLALELLSELAS